MATRRIEGATNWPLTFPTIPLALLSPNVYGNFGQAGRMCPFVSRSLLFSTPKTRSPSQPPFSYPTLIDLPRDPSFSDRWTINGSQSNRLWLQFARENDEIETVHLEIDRSSLQRL